jgi:SRSO17 transposase
MISDSAWDHRVVLDRIAQDASKRIDKKHLTALIIDESGVPKKGTMSVGVGKQYCGKIGKVDNSQVAVFSALANGYSCTITDTQLYLPVDWTSDEKRCDKAKIPVEERKFRTKQEIALDIIDHQREIGIDFDYTVFDGFYGKDCNFLKELDLRKIEFMADFPNHQKIYLSRPSFKVPKKRIGTAGRTPFKKRPTVEGLSVAKYFSTLRKGDFRTMSIRNSTKGRLKAEYHFATVWIVDEENEMVHRRRMIIQKKGNKLEKCSLTNSNRKDLKQLIFMQNQRYFIEHAFREIKNEIGMDHYQVRKWKAWYHQVTLTILALFIIFMEKQYIFDEWPLMSARDIVEILSEQLDPQISISKKLDQLTLRHLIRQRQINDNLRFKPNLSK